MAKCCNKSKLDWEAKWNKKYAAVLPNNDHDCLQHFVLDWLVHRILYSEGFHVTIHSLYKETTLIGYEGQKRPRFIWFDFLHYAGHKIFVNLLLFLIWNNLTTAYLHLRKLSDFHFKMGWESKIRVGKLFPSKSTWQTRNQNTFLNLSSFCFQFLNVAVSQSAWWRNAPLPDFRPCVAVYRLINWAFNTPVADLQSSPSGPSSLIL